MFSLCFACLGTAMHTIGLLVLVKTLSHGKLTVVILFSTPHLDLFKRTNSTKSFESNFFETLAQSSEFFWDISSVISYWNTNGSFVNSELLVICFQRVPTHEWLPCVFRFSLVFPDGVLRKNNHRNNNNNNKQISGNLACTRQEPPMMSSLESSNP